MGKIFSVSLTKPVSGADDDVLYGIVGVMLVCDIVLCVSDYHKAGMQEIIKDLGACYDAGCLFYFCAGCGKVH